MTEHERFTYAIRTAFIRIGLTKIGEIADYMGLSYSTLTKLMYGQTTISENVYRKLEDIGISPHFIKEGKGQPFMPHANDPKFEATNMALQADVDGQYRNTVGELIDELDGMERLFGNLQREMDSIKQRLSVMREKLDILATR